MCVFIEVDPCENVNCVHGSCKPSPEDTEGYVCVCVAGWSGTLCDEGNKKKLH